MTVYTSTKYHTKLEFEPKLGMISVTKSGSGNYVLLDERSLRELAFEILETQFDITYPISSTGAIVLDKKSPPPRPLPRVGEYYRVRSVPTMMDEFQDNPIVKVESVSARGYGFYVRTAAGAGSRWHTLEYLEGPIDVREKTVWEAK